MSIKIDGFSISNGWGGNKSIFSCYKKNKGKQKNHKDCLCTVKTFEWKLPPAENDLTTHLPTFIAYIIINRVNDILSLSHLLPS